MAQDKMNIRFRISAVDNFSRNMKKLDRQLDSVQRQMAVFEAVSPEVDIDADTSDYFADVAKVKATNKALENDTVHIGFRARYKMFRRSVDRIADVARDVGAIARSQLMSALLSIAPAAVPAIASITGAVATLGNSLGVAAGAAMGLGTAFGLAGAGAAAFGGLAVTNIGKVIEANEELKDLQDKLADTTDAEKRAEIIAEMEKIQGNLNEKQKEALNATNKLGSAWSKLAESLETETLNSYINFLGGLETALGKLEPVFVGSAKAAEELSQYFKDAMNAPDVEKIFSTMGDTVGSVFETMGKAAMDFGIGTLSMLEAFVPLATKMAGGFREMGASFREWAAGLGESERFQAFIDYINENGPKLLDIFGSLTLGIVDLFAAFGPLSSDMLSGLQDLINRFQEWASTVSDNEDFQAFIDYIRKNGPGVISLIGNFTKFLVNLGRAFAPIGEKVLNFVNGFLELANSFMEGNRTVSSVIAGFMSFLSVISLVVPWVVLLSSKLLSPIRLLGDLGRVVAGLKFGKFIGALRLIPGPIGIVVGAIVGLIAIFRHLWKTNEDFREVVTTIWNGIKETFFTVLTAIGTFIMEIWNGIKTFWDENQASILAAARNVWNTIQLVITTVLQSITVIFQTIWPLIQTIVSTAWGVIKSIISGALNVIMGIIKVFSGLLTGDWSLLWEGIKQIFSTVTEVLKSIAEKLAQGVVNSIKWLFNTGKKLVSAGWKFIKGVFSAVTQAIWGIVKSIFASIIGTITSAMGSIRNIISTVWGAIKGLVSRVINGIFSNVKNVFNNIKSAISGAVNGAKQVVSSTFNRIKSTVSSAVGNVFSTAKSKFNQTKEAISGAMGKARDAVRNGVNKIKGFFKINLFKSGKAMINSVKDGINAAKDKVINTAKSVAGKIRNLWPFSPAKEGPLSDIHRMDFKGPITDSIKRSRSPILREMNRLVQLPEVAFPGVSNPYGNPANKYGMERNPTTADEGYDVPIQFNIDGRQIVDATIHLTDRELQKRKVKSSKSRGRPKTT